MYFSRLFAPLLRFSATACFCFGHCFFPYARAAVLLSIPGNATHSLFCSILSFHDAISSHRFICLMVMIRKLPPVGLLGLPTPLKPIWLDTLSSCDYTSSVFPPFSCVALLSADVTSALPPLSTGCLRLGVSLLFASTLVLYRQAPFSHPFHSGFDAASCPGNGYGLS